jgi:pyrroloquinoline quinone biosynthesis protein D
MLTPSQIPDDTKPRLARGVRFQIDPRTSQGVLLFPEGILELNETAQEIVTRCDGRTLAEIVRTLAEEYEASVETVAADVRETLADLEHRKLLRFE